jgi:hypothetical protein
MIRGNIRTGRVVCNLSLEMRLRPALLDGKTKIKEEGPVNRFDSSAPPLDRP